MFTVMGLNDLTNTQRMARELEEQISRLKHLMYVRPVEKGYGLTATQMFILRYLDKRGTAKASDISKACGLSPGAVTQICDELETLGLVARNRSQDDRRVVIINLTDLGVAKLEEIRQHVTDRLVNIVDKVPPHEMEQFMRVFRKIIELSEKDF
ncbi:MarR family transcriptional regulator [Alicyclobacillus pomorum]